MTDDILEKKASGIQTHQSLYQTLCTVGENGRKKNRPIKIVLKEKENLIANLLSYQVLQRRSASLKMYPNRRELHTKELARDAKPKINVADKDSANWRVRRNSKNRFHLKKFSKARPKSSSTT